MKILYCILEVLYIDNIINYNKNKILGGRVFRDVATSFPLWGFKFKFSIHYQPPSHQQPPPTKREQNGPYTEYIDGR